MAVSGGAQTLTIFPEDEGLGTSIMPRNSVSELQRLNMQPAENG